MLAEGELEANKIYTEAFSKDKKFFELFRTLESYKDAFNKDNSTFVIAPNNQFCKTMKEKDI